MHSTTTPAAKSLRSVPALADTVRLWKGDSEIVFVFTGTQGSKVHVSEDGAAVLWPYEQATHELAMRIRLGWTVTPVAAD